MSGTQNSSTFAEAMDRAVAEKHLPNPSLDIGSLGPNQTDSSAYIRALRARLIDLGYLGASRQNRTHEIVDSALVKAIQRFQRDAVLLNPKCRVDGWAGPVTWGMLECLVSIENNQGPDQWHCMNKLKLSNPAIQRAVYLRLFILGFFDSWKQPPHLNTQLLPNNPAFTNAVARFIAFAKDLGLIPKNTRVQLSKPVCNALFQHDMMVQRLAQKTAQACFADYSDNIKAIARAELWMLGYAVSPGAPKRQRVRKSPRPGSGFKQVATDQVAIDDFCRDQQLQISPRNKMSPQLFAAFAQLLNSDTNTIYVGKQVAHQVQQALSQEASKKTFLNNMKNLANGIWDGLKRLTKWLFQMFRKSLSLGANVLANLARYVSKQARRLYVDVVKSLDILYGAHHYLRRDIQRSSQHHTLAITFDSDFDHLSLFDPEALPQDLAQGIHNYRRHSQAYIAATRILSTLFRIFMRVRYVLVAASGPLSWITALSRSRVYGTVPRLFTWKEPPSQRINFSDSAPTHSSEQRSVSERSSSRRNT